MATFRYTPLITMDLFFSTVIFRNESRVFEKAYATLWCVTGNGFFPLSLIKFLTGSPL